MSDRDAADTTKEDDSTAGTIDPETLRTRIDADEPVTILDVRTSSDYEEWHIEGPSVESTNVPYYQFLEDETVTIGKVPDGDPLVVVCAEGDASGYVADLLVDAGRDAVNMKNGMNAWARLYDRIEISRYDGPGTLIQYHRPSTGCLSYFVESAGEAAVIDPLRAFTDEYIEDASTRGADLKYAIDTHCHADHVSGVGSLTETGVTGIVPAATIDRGMEIAADVTAVEDGDVLNVGDVTIEVTHTPGHTSGMTSYFVENQVLLTGDSLFAGSVARPDLEAGDEGASDAARQLYDSLHERILSLDEGVLIAGGHRAENETSAEDGSYTAYLGTLIEDMDVLSMDKADFVEYIQSNMPPRPANFETIIDANLGHREVDDAEAFRIELGPNNCAASQESSLS